jgi:probable rRNA maturation factor
LSAVLSKKNFNKLLDLTYINNVKKLEFGRAFFYSVIENAVSHLGLEEKQIGLSINIVGEKKIRHLNQKHRGKDKATDVLSFPTSPVRISPPQRLSGRARTGADSNRAGAKIESGDILELGDIFICLPIVEKEARDEGTNIKNEMAFLAVHGFLHLIGYDHETPKQTKEMFDLQGRILNK